MTDALLSVRNLRVVYPGDDGDFRAVRNVSFTLGRERLGIVGESGSGKSTTGRAIMGLIAKPGRVEASSIYEWFEGDFGGFKGVLAHMSRYAKPALRSQIAGITKIDAYDYDWRLNDAAKR